MIRIEDKGYDTTSVTFGDHPIQHQIFVDRNSGDALRDELDWLDARYNDVTKELHLERQLVAERRADAKTLTDLKNKIRDLGHENRSLKAQINTYKRYVRQVRDAWDAYVESSYSFGDDIDIEENKK